MKKNHILFIVFLGISICCFYLWFSTFNVSKIKFHELKSIDLLYSNNCEIYVYFGRPSCENCRKFQKKVEENNEHLPRIIYYFNTDKWRDHGITDAVCKKYGIETVPTLIRIKDSKCVEIIDITKYINDP